MILSETAIVGRQSLLKGKHAAPAAFPVSTNSIKHMASQPMRLIGSAVVHSREYYMLVISIGSLAVSCYADTAEQSQTPRRCRR